jgi:alkylhydroperoxidase/carboxymuconolactone decarboxylase family protein YurZ
MSEHLPAVYQRFIAAYPDVIEAQHELSRLLHASGPLSAAERRLAKLGIAVGSGSPGAVRSHARKALAEGISVEAMHHVVVLAISTAGFPAAIAAYAWVNEVVDAEAAATSSGSPSSAGGGPA